MLQKFLNSLKNIFLVLFVIFAGVLTILLVNGFLQDSCCDLSGAPVAASPMKATLQFLLFAQLVYFWRDELTGGRLQRRQWEVSFVGGAAAPLLFILATFFLVLSNA